MNRINLKPILDTFAYSLGYSLLKVEIHSVDNTHFKKQIFFEVVFKDDTFIAGIGLVDLNGRAKIFQRFRSTAMVTGKLYPLHQLDKVCIVPDSRV